MKSTTAAAIQKQQKELKPFAMIQVNWSAQNVLRRIAIMPPNGEATNVSNVADLDASLQLSLETRPIACPTATWESTHAAKLSEAVQVISRTLRLAAQPTMESADVKFVATTIVMGFNSLLLTDFNASLALVTTAILQKIT